MPPDLPLMVQTAYAELLDRAAAAAFDDAFPVEGAFTAKTLRGRRYWYFQSGSADGRSQKYVGAETPELLDRIARYKAARDYRRDQRSLVAMLVRAGNLPRPSPPIGDVVSALADAGVFRLRGVLVGTVAYQTYPALLGCRLPAALTQTLDVDLAQFAEISAAVEDTTRPMVDVLRLVDTTFRPVPHVDPKRAVSYVAASGLRVDFLTPNRGRDTEEPRKLPALGTDAQPLRFLDFLIRDPEHAVLLHAAGILVSVPSPQRFGLHKLIVARRRREGDPKRDKDIFQAQALINVLIDRRPIELRDAWSEAFARGRTWQRLLGESTGLLHPATRDGLLKAVGASRSVVPGLDLAFVPGRARYDADQDGVRFFAFAGRQSVSCVVGRNALEARAGRSLEQRECLPVFRRFKGEIEAAARKQYLDDPVVSIGEVHLVLAAA